LHICVNIFNYTMVENNDLTVPHTFYFLSFFTRESPVWVDAIITWLKKKSARQKKDYTQEKSL